NCRARLLRDGRRTTSRATQSCRAGSTRQWRCAHAPQFPDWRNRVSSVHRPGDGDCLEISRAPPCFWRALPPTSSTEPRSSSTADILPSSERLGEGPGMPARTIVYSSLGPELEVFELDPETGALARIQTYRFDVAVQSAWPNRART